MHSFQNAFEAILRAITDDPESIYALSEVLDLHQNTLRERLRKPHLWQLAELHKIAAHYRLATIGITNTEYQLRQWCLWLKMLPAEDRNQVLRFCHMDRKVLRNRERLGWGVENVRMIRTGLRHWMDRRQNEHLLA